MFAESQKDFKKLPLFLEDIFLPADFNTSLFLFFLAAWLCPWPDAESESEESSLTWRCLLDLDALKVRNSINHNESQNECNWQRQNTQSKLRKDLQKYCHKVLYHYTGLPNTCCMYILFYLYKGSFLQLSSSSAQTGLKHNCCGHMVGKWRYKGQVLFVTA